MVPTFEKSPSHLRECYSMRSNQCVRQWSVHLYIYIYLFIYFFFCFFVDRFKTFISLQIPFKHLLWIPPQAVIASRASEGGQCLLITCHWLERVKLEHVEVVRLRYGKAVVDLPPPGPFDQGTEREIILIVLQR